jgi:hypothetical protein
MQYERMFGLRAGWGMYSRNEAGLGGRTRGRGFLRAVIIALCLLFSDVAVLAEQIVMKTSKGEISFAMNSDPSISIDWGDETISDGADGTGVVVSEIAGYTVEFSHKYRDKKLHTIVVTATSFRYMVCRDNQLTSLAVVSDCPNLDRLYVNHNLLTSLDIHRCLNLKILDCSDNQLTRLHVGSGRGADLEQLYVNDNQLTDLSIVGCDHLEILNCANNQLTQLDDLWHMPKLEKLYCSGNQLATIDLWNNDELMGLYIENNQLTRLFLDHCTELIELSCGKNPLQSLDVSHCRLGVLWCYDTQITDLDMSDQYLLHRLYCANILLRSLDLSKCRSLYELDVSGCRLLEKLICRSDVEVESEGCYALQIQSPPKPERTRTPERYR